VSVSSFAAADAGCDAAVPHDCLSTTSLARRRTVTMTDTPASRLMAARTRAHPSPARGASATANSPAARRPTTTPSLAANYPGLHELVEERIFPFMQQVVGFLGIG